MKQYCTFKIENEIFGIEVNSIQEIINIPKFTKIPRSKDHITGMFTLRGQIVTNLSLHILFKISQAHDCSHCIVLDKGSDPISMNVNEILDIIDINPENIEAVPDMIPPYVKSHLEGIFKSNEQIITLIDIEKLHY